MNQPSARELLEQNMKCITLDGEPAGVSGLTQQFPTIWSRQDLARSAEFSWYAIENVMREHGGAFKTKPEARKPRRVKR